MWRFGQFWERGHSVVVDFIVQPGVDGSDAYAARAVDALGQLQLFRFNLLEQVPVGLAYGHKRPVVDSE